MAWTKDATSQAPLVVYMAPEESFPLVSITLDETGPERVWLARYAYFTGPEETVEQVESAMGL